jgi:hypothetical protein
VNGAISQRAAVKGGNGLQQFSQNLERRSGLSFDSAGMKVH